MKTIKVAIKAIITVRRPNGEIEKVSNPAVKFISEKNFEIIKEATFKANGSVVLSVENISEMKTGCSIGEAMHNMADKTVENMSKMGE